MRLTSWGLAIMDGLTDMQREIIQRGIVTKEKALQFNESLNLDEYGTRET